MHSKPPTTSFDTKTKWQPPYNALEWLSAAHFLSFYNEIFKHRLVGYRYNVLIYVFFLYRMYKCVCCCPLILCANNLNHHKGPFTRFVLQRILDWKISAPVLRLNFRALSSSSSSSADDTDSAEVTLLSRYSDKPWEYLESEGKYD